MSNTFNLTKNRINDLLKQLSENNLIVTEQYNEYSSQVRDASRKKDNQTLLKIEAELKQILVPAPAKKKQNKEYYFNLLQERHLEMQSNKLYEKNDELQKKINRILMNEGNDITKKELKSLSDQLNERLKIERKEVKKRTADDIKKNIKDLLTNASKENLITVKRFNEISASILSSKRGISTLEKIEDELIEIFSTESRKKIDLREKNEILDNIINELDKLDAPSSTASSAILSNTNDQIEKGILHENKHDVQAVENQIKMMEKQGIARSTIPFVASIKGHDPSDDRDIGIGVFGGGDDDADIAYEKQKEKSYENEKQHKKDKVNRELEDNAERSDDNNFLFRNGRVYRDHAGRIIKNLRDHYINMLHQKTLISRDILSNIINRISGLSDWTTYLYSLSAGILRETGRKFAPDALALMLGYASNAAYNYAVSDNKSKIVNIDDKGKTIIKNPFGVTRESILNAESITNLIPAFSHVFYSGNRLTPVEKQIVESNVINAPHVNIMSTPTQNIGKFAQAPSTGQGGMLSSSEWYYSTPFTYTYERMNKEKEQKLRQQFLERQKNKKSKLYI